MSRARVILLVLCLHIFIGKGEIAASGDGNVAVKPSNPLSSCSCPPGRDGLPGRDGRDGISGPQGPAGFPGFPGHKGVKGDLATAEESGNPGLQGAPGPRGPQGNVGAKGEKGDTSNGPPGLQGTPGPRGPQGNVGAKGEKGVRGSPAAVVGGVTYNRWGNTNCRSGVQRVYAGRTGSTYSGHQGGASNYLCMPNDPEYSQYQTGVRGHSYVYGTEYELPLSPGHAQHNAPCAVCYIPTQNTVLMIPAKTSCPSGWTREYYGYLMSEYVGNRRTEYVCVDRNMESIPGSQNHIDGGHFWHVEAHCNGVACPPYNNQKELTCVVCSK